jgi:hypothetical protein
MNALEGLLAEIFITATDLMENDAPINFIQKTHMHACERFSDMVRRFRSDSVVEF